ncbi:hypothetical protein RhiLY_06620 [Ceratobasidium sp. AG-Ba]|nr:hypothetical protein RhiLY_06620 [Ceratobasidium sp. AG-Ba]
MSDSEISYTYISSDDTSAPPSSPAGGPALSLPPSSPPPYNTLSSPPAFTVNSPPSVPLSSPSPVGASTPETEINFDYNLADALMGRIPGGPCSALTWCPGCERDWTHRKVCQHRRDHCGALRSEASNAVVECRWCGNQVTRHRARKHQYTGCDPAMREHLWNDPAFRNGYYLWYNYLHKINDYE